jgi:hypothetical protein
MRSPGSVSSWKWADVVAQTPVRHLAYLYYQGKLEKDAYRRQRGELLDGLVRGERHLDEQGAPGAQETHAAGAALRRGLHSPTVLALAAAAVAAGLVWILLGQGPSIPSPVTPMDNAAVSSGPSALMEEFLHETDWGAESMSDFLQAWLAYTEEQRRAARGLTGFRRLSDAVNRQIDQERALIDLGVSGQSLRQIHRLTAFAHALHLPVRVLEDSERPAPPRSGPPAPVPASEAQSSHPAPPAIEPTGLSETSRRLSHQPQG